VKGNVRIILTEDRNTWKKMLVSLCSPQIPHDGQVAMGKNFVESRRVLCNKKTMAILRNKAATICNIFLFTSSAKQINILHDKCALNSFAVSKIFLSLKAGSV
jgi:hypothetical protein